MSFQYFSGQVRGLRGPGLTAEQAADVAVAVALGPTVESQGERITAAEAAIATKAEAGAVNTGLDTLQGNVNTVNGQSIARDNALGARIDGLGSAASRPASDFATAAQGGKADSAVQPGDLGSAASRPASDFATAAQGTKADTAVQPSALGSAALRPASDFAAAADGLTQPDRDKIAAVPDKADKTALASETTARQKDSQFGADFLPAIVAAVRALITRSTGLLESRVEARDHLRAIAMRETVRRTTGAVQSGGIDVVAFQRPVRRDGLPSSQVEIEDVVWTVAGSTVTVQSGRTALRSAGRAIYPSTASVTIDPVSTATVAGEARTLSFVNANFVESAAGRLAHGHVSTVVVKDASTSAVLALGTDYRLNTDQGAVSLVSAGSDRPVLVDYSWSGIRYDLIEMALDGTLTVKKGTERDRDVAEYLPARSAGKTPLLIVRVTSAGLTVWRWQDIERSLVQAPAIIQRNRARNLGSFHRALRSGSAVKIAGYGTSRTNLGLVAAAPYAANGPERDRMTAGFLMTQGADFIATLPLFDHADGAGAVHTHIGWNWALKAAIERLYPNAVEYLNFGIGGTTSGNTSNGGTVPARLAGLTGSGAHLAVIEFGMNELGATSVDTLADLIAIGEACRTAGIDPVFIAPARPNATYASDVADKWVLENRQVAAAADYLAAPFVDTASVFGVDRIGPLDPRECCTSNLLNHDSVFELGLIGRALTATVLDA